MNTPSTQADPIEAGPHFDDRRVIRERVSVRCDGGVLAGTLCYPAEGPVGWSALLAGPHPLLGGEHRNNVVEAVQTAIAAQGAAALAFDYTTIREKDPSGWVESVSQFWREGRVPQESRWIEDAENAHRALRRWSQGPLVLAGYSFGAWVVSQIAQRVAARAVILISPNPTKHSFDALAGSSANLLIVHSNNDFACPAEQLLQWFDGLREPKKRALVAAGEHFFRGCEPDVAAAAGAFVIASGIAERAT